MKRIFTTIAPIAIATLLLMVGCKKENLPDTILSIAQQSYTLDASATEIEVEVYSNIDFVFKVSDEGVTWIEHSNTQITSTGIKLIVFNILANEGDESREADIIFTSGDGYITQSVHITQSPREIIVANDDRYVVDYHKQRLDIDIQSNTNIECSIESADEWIKLAESRALESHTLSFDIAENTSGAKREATITISSKDESKVITVIQTVKGGSTHLAITHTQTSLISPLWYGISVEGNVEWGDGSEESWSENIEHIFTDNSEKITTFDMQSPKSFTIQQLGTITNIEITYSK